MTLKTLPSQLLNSDREQCFASCLGMVLAHYERLGDLGLGDIITAIGSTSDEDTPVAKGLGWLQTFDLTVEYVEDLSQVNTNLADSLRTEGIAHKNIRPTPHETV